MSGFEKWLEHNPQGSCYLCCEKAWNYALEAAAKAAYGFIGSDVEDAPHIAEAIRKLMNRRK